MKDIEEQADIDGPLVDYSQKGHTVELLGKDKAEGTDCYKLKVTLKNGDTRLFFIDAENFLDVRMEGTTTVRGTEVSSETIVGDWKEVSGMMMPFSVESGQKGNPQRQKITLDKVEVNPVIDDARFKMPDVKK